MTNKDSATPTAAEFLTGQSAAINRVNRLIQQVAAYDSNVLLKRVYKRVGSSGRLEFFFKRLLTRPAARLQVIK